MATEVNLGIIPSEGSESRGWTSWFLVPSRRGVSQGAMKEFYFIMSKKGMGISTGELTFSGKALFSGRAGECKEPNGVAPTWADR